MIRPLWYFYTRKIQPGFRIAPHERVIDIGSGDKPFWRGDVFFDDLALGHEQRFTANATVTAFGEFVNGHLPVTPFRDGEFDFSFCAHVLEHVADPAAAIRELMRISRRGYIEVPNGVLEVMDPFHSHLWLVFRDADELVFYRKSRALHHALKANSVPFKPLLPKMADPFIRYHWTGTIRFRIIHELSDDEAFWPEPEAQRMVPVASAYLRVARLLRAAFYPRRARRPGRGPQTEAAAGDDRDGRGDEGGRERFQRG